MVFLATIKDQKLTFDNKQSYETYCNKAKSGSYKVEIKSTKSRSLPLNSYYWGVVLDFIYMESGQNPELLHEFFKTKFLEKQEIFGTMVFPSTASLTNEDFIKYIENIKLWAFDFLGLSIPPPM